MYVPKKHLILFCLLLLNFIFVVPSVFSNTDLGNTKILYEQKLERNLQSMINAMVGARRVVIDVNVETIFPSPRRDIPPKIRRLQVNLLVDQRLHYKEVQRVQKFIAEYLKISPRSIAIHKQAFYYSSYNKNKLSRNKGFKKLEKIIPAFARNLKIKTGDIINILISLFYVFFILSLLVVIWLLIIVIKHFIMEKGYSSFKNNLEGFLHRKGMGTNVFCDMGDYLDYDLEDSTTQLRERRFFQFVNKKNIHKLKYLLQDKIAQDEISTQTIAMILSCLPYELSQKILMDYPPKIQAEIISHLISPEHYDEGILVQLETDILEKMGTLLGGQITAKGILESIPTSQRESVYKTISKQYPSVLKVINHFSVSFEDLFIQEEEVLEEIFLDIPDTVIACAIFKLNKDSRRMFLSLLDKNKRKLVNRWLKHIPSYGVSSLEIDMAQKSILEHGKLLEAQGQIILARSK